jgi:hypothetical protein
MSEKPLAFTAVTFLCERCGKRWEEAALGTKTSESLRDPRPSCGTRIETFYIDGVETVKETVPKGNGQCENAATCSFFKKHL